jgi:hypothetical protein
MVKRISYLTLLLIFTFNPRSPAQNVDATSFRMNSRLSFYSYEKNGEMILHIPPGSVWSNLNITLKVNGMELTSWDGVPRKKTLSLPFKINMPPSSYKIEAEIKSSKGTIYKAESELVILNYKPNEVKTDRLTGGLIVSRRIFFPFGFYCYSPVHPTLPEEEVVKGFNMISPYQKIYGQVC